MTSIKDQFTSKTIKNHFESDPHIDLDHLEVDRIEILSGETVENDIIVISYKSSPILSFYNSNGKLIDVDHYLPDFYKEQDVKGASDVIKNLKKVNLRTLKAKRSFCQAIKRNK